MNDQTEYRLPVPTDLSFVSANKYWDVFPTGNDEQDWETGKENFREAVAFTERKDTSHLLNLVLQDIVRSAHFGALEKGFIIELNTFALLHQNSLRSGVIEHCCVPIVYPDQIAPKNRPWRLPASLRPPNDSDTTSPEGPAQQIGTEPIDPELDES